MAKLSIIGAGVLLWGIVIAFCIPHDGHFIQHDLTAKSSALLSQHNLPISALSVDGRDVTLTGYKDSPEVSDDTVKLVAATWGVRTVKTNIIPRPEPPKPVVTRQQAVEASASIGSILKLHNVEFYTNSDRLTPVGQHTVNQVAAVLGKYPGMQVEIEGHTDSIGNPESNMELSRKRAAAVKQYLIAKGIPGENLKDAGFGATKPIASNATAAGRQENRRVEFHTKETN